MVASRDARECEYLFEAFYYYFPNGADDHSTLAENPILSPPGVSVSPNAPRINPQSEDSPVIPAGTATGSVGTSSHQTPADKLETLTESILAHPVAVTSPRVTLTRRPGRPGRPARPSRRCIRCVRYRKEVCALSYLMISANTFKVQVFDPRGALY